MDLLSLNRRIYTNKSTIGDLYYRGDPFCQTLELTCRRAGEQGPRAISAGRFRVVLTPSARYGRLMPRLCEVPGRSGILIHWGNTPQDTEGCILVGSYNEKIPDFVSTSRKTFDALYAKLKEERDEIFLSITGGLK